LYPKIRSNFVEMLKKIAIIEDNKILREGYTYLINTSNAQYEVVATFDNAEEAIIYLKQNPTDIVLMDIDLNGKMNGIEATKYLKRNIPAIEILMITVWESSAKVFDALCAGASGYITKNGSSVEIISSLDQLCKGGAPMSAAIARMVISSLHKNNNTPLNETETKTLTYLSNGKGYKTIAKEMNISVDSIKYYIKNIYEKLQVSNKEDAIDKARENRWI